MNKSELVEKIAKGADISKAAAERSLDSTITAIKKELKMVSFSLKAIFIFSNYFICNVSL